MQKCNRSIYVTFILCIHQRISICNFVTKIIISIVGSPQLIVVCSVGGAGCSTTGCNAIYDAYKDTNTNNRGDCPCDGAANRE